MLKIVELTKNYTDDLEEELIRIKGLLESARTYALNNYSHCTVTGCSQDNPCKTCMGWQKIWEDIDKYLKE